ncbi:MAG: hypothetical protein O9326_10845 [Microcystis sp. LE19-338.1B]|jgi:hypothetical protein|nr:hypothetical protein [Microcystis sp. LE19-338.1B]MCZ8360084.1 hypothetical protein [Microcystis sp. LE19-388.1G]
MYNNFFSRNGKRASRVTQRILGEVVEEGYEFHIHIGDEKLVAHANQIQLTPQGILYKIGEDERTLPYDRFTVQVFPKSKIVNLIKELSFRMMILLASLPGLIGGFLWAISVRTSQRAVTPLFSSYFDTVFSFFGVTRDEVRGFALAIIIVSYPVMFAVSWYIKQASYQREISAASVSPQLIDKLDEASDVDEYFSRLIQVNLRNMEQYYLLVRTQTEKSYRLTQFAAFIGFSTLVAGILLSFSQGLNSPATVVTIASGALIEFISAIFFYMYNRTVTELNKYHEKLISVQDTMLALKVAQIVKNDDLKDRTMAYLTRALTNSLSRTRQLEFEENFLDKNANAVQRQDTTKETE